MLENQAEMVYLSTNESTSIIAESENAKYQLNITCNEVRDVGNLTDKEINGGWDSLSKQ